MDGEDSILSPSYDHSRPESYFRQCFDVIEEIGQGSYARVFKVRSKDDGRIYAVKETKEPNKGRGDRERKLAEVKTVQQLKESPYCIRYYNAWEEKNILYIQTEYCERGSLKKYCQRLGEGIREPVLWEILTDICLGLHHMHLRNIVHMDIKPDNVFMTGSMSVKMGDFGLAGRAGDSSHFQEGDPAYLPPEVFSAKSFDKRADIYSFGMTILYVGCDYEFPSRGNDWRKIREGDVPGMLFSTLSDEMAELIKRMIDPDPSKRPTTADILAHPRVAFILRSRRKNRIFKYVGGFLGAMFASVFAYITLILSIIHAFFSKLFSPPKPIPPPIHINEPDAEPEPIESDEGERGSPVLKQFSSEAQPIQQSTAIKQQGSSSASQQQQSPGYDSSSDIGSPSSSSSPTLSRAIDFRPESKRTASSTVRRRLEGARADTVAEERGVTTPKNLSSIFDDVADTQSS